MNREKLEGRHPLRLLGGRARGRRSRPPRSPRRLGASPSAQEAGKARPRGDLRGAAKLGHEPVYQVVDGRPRRSPRSRARGGPLLQPHRVLRRRRHEGHEHRGVPRPARQAVHGRRPARPLPRAGQGARQEDLRVPRHPHAVFRDVLPGQARPFPRHRLPAHRQADVRGRLDRHRRGLGGRLASRS